MLLEQYVLDIIEGRKKALFFSKLLSLASAGYCAGVSFRNWLYDKKIFKSYNVNACVVSIGNIVAGGTGKTPIIHLLSTLIAPDVPTAIITRGYRSKIEKSGLSVCISSAEGVKVPVEDCGDEPFWLASQTLSQVWVGRNKLLSARKAVEHKAKILFIDDGLQHRRLQRDFEIILLDASDPWGKNAFLPKGLLRDSPKRLKDADLILISNCSNSDEFNVLKNRISELSSSNVVHVQRRFYFDDLLENFSVGVFCGIAKPELFINAIKSSNINIVDKIFSPDHMLPKYEDLQAFAESCKNNGAKALICTEKDFVKLPKDIQLSLPIICLKMKLIIEEGKDEWNRCIEKIITKGKAFL